MEHSKDCHKYGGCVGAESCPPCTCTPKEDDPELQQSHKDCPACYGLMPGGKPCRLKEPLPTPKEDWADEWGKYSNGEIVDPIPFIRTKRTRWMNEATQAYHARIVAIVEKLRDEKEPPNTDYNDGGDPEYRNRRDAIESRKYRAYLQALTDLLSRIQALSATTPSGE